MAPVARDSKSRRLEINQSRYGQNSKYARNRADKM
jgi:hypothetical protein